MKRRMIDKKLFRKLMIIVCLISLIVVFVQITKTAARYVSKVNAEKQVDVAFFMIDNDFKEKRRMILEDLLPSDTAYEYTFSVFNNDGVSRSEVDMEYDVTITATTNLPLVYTVEKDGELCTLTETIVQIPESTGAYYKKIVISSDDNDLTLSHTQDETDAFVIKVTFPKGYSTEEGYADLIESINLEVEGRQIIE